MFTVAELEATAERVHKTLGGPTPAFAWPLLAKRAGCEVWVKHENHTPIGAFKVRGGLVYMDELAASGDSTGVIAATRGNHGQSIALAARQAGLSAIIYVPEGNSVEKNAAMEAFGAELVVQGRDFDEAYAASKHAAIERGLHMVPSFDPLLVKGVATYGLEFFRQAPDLDVVYVPIGMGSGICGTMAARDALNLETEIVGVVAQGAPTVALSYESGDLVPTNEAHTFADGLACRVPNADALELIRRGASRVVQVSDAAIADAMRALYSDTHNIAEGAGAAPLAALLAEKDLLKGKKAGIVLSGGNIDRAVYAKVLAGETP